MNEYDKRQLMRMNEKITGFKQNKILLGWLIEDLEALLNVLEEKDENWEVNFRTSWFDLEQVYAFALYKERDYLDEDEVKMVNESIDELSKLIELRLQAGKKVEKIES